MTPAVRDVLFSGPPGWVLRGTQPADLHFDFFKGRFFQRGFQVRSRPDDLVTTSRASNATDLLPTSPVGYNYRSYGNNVLNWRPESEGGIGAIIFQSATNLSAYPTAPQNETIIIPTTGSYTLWVNGTGSATVAAGTAVGANFGTATNGSPVTFTISVIGTVLVTVAGSLMALQLEQGTFGTPFIPQASGSRAADVVKLATFPKVDPSVSGTIFFSFILPFLPPGFGTFVSLTDGTINNQIRTFRGNSNQSVQPAIVSVGSVKLGGGSIGNLVTGSPNKTAFTYGPGNYISGSLNGAAVISFSPTGMPPDGTLTELDFGFPQTGVQFLNGIFGEIAWFNGSPQSSGIIQRITQ